MIFSKTTKYLVRICWYLGKNIDRVVSAKELTEELKIPYKYLTHLMLKLRKAGLVKNYRGKMGGYKLVKSPDKIYLSEIVEIDEDIEEIEKCIFLINEDCTEKIMCALHEDWMKIKYHLKKMLYEKTVADILNIKIKFKEFNKKGVKNEIKKSN